MVERHAAEYTRASKTIWEYAELGYHEDKSSALLQRGLKQAGFRVEAGVAREPTAFHSGLRPMPASYRHSG